MEAIRLQNIRSLADTGPILLRPLTLLLGQNSSGKSTVLRALPLVAQSLKTRSNAPVLWYGDAVDFGSVSEVRSTFAQDETVKIELDLGDVIFRSRIYYPGAPSRQTVPVKFKTELDEVDSRTKVRSFSLMIDTDLLVVSVDMRGQATALSINGRDYIKHLPSDRVRFLTSDFIPQLRIRPSAEESRSPYYDPYRRPIELPEREIRRILTPRLHGRVSDETVAALSRRIRYQPPSRFAAALRDLSTPLKSWKGFVEALDPDDGLLNELRELALLASLADILASADRELHAVAESVSYVGPSRATGERYYRIQELAVDQIDPQGKNLAMFLDSLSAAQLRSFSNWLTAAIGYGIKINRSSGHIQIELKEQASSRYYNIADMGYGFSQVLPIMAQIWGRPESRNNSGAQRIFAMEQPELHLHPAYQARLADVFTAAIKTERANRPPVRFLVETHSEAIINRLGELVYAGEISPEDIAIYVFEKSSQEEITQIRPVTFLPDGTLENWPIGFFSAGIA